MNKQTILQEIRQIQDELRQSWRDDLPNKKRQFTLKEQHRYNVLDNLASILEAIEGNDLRTIARMINKMNQKITAHAD